MMMKAAEQIRRFFTGGTTMKDIKTVGIIGLGSLGTLYAHLLTTALGKERVLVLADSSRTERYQAHGTYFNEQLCDFNPFFEAEGDVASACAFSESGVCDSDFSHIFLSLKKQHIALICFNDIKE